MSTDLGYRISLNYTGRDTDTEWRRPGLWNFLILLSTDIIAIKPE